jgi:hypothetical protein
VPLSQLTFGLLIFPGVWDWYLQWREQRRGFYTKWEEDMLMVAQALTRAEVGWIRQHPELLKNVRPIEGLIAPEEIQFATRDWHGACDAFPSARCQPLEGSPEGDARTSRSIRADHGARTRAVRNRTLRRTD